MGSILRPKKIADFVHQFMRCDYSCDFFYVYQCDIFEKKYVRCECDAIAIPAGKLETYSSEF